MVNIQWIGVSAKDLKLKEGGGLETPNPMSRTTFADLHTPSPNLGVLQASSAQSPAKTRHRKS